MAQGHWGWVPGPDLREAEVGEAAGHLLATKELHSQKCEDDNEQEKEKQQADDGFHGVEERDDQVPERRPVPAEGGRRWGGRSGRARVAAAEPTFLTCWKCPPPHPHVPHLQRLTL